MSEYKGKYQSIGGDVNISRQKKNAGAQYSFWSGVGLILVILIWIALVECPSNSQFSIFRIVLSLALGSLVASLPQFFRVNLSGIAKFGAGLLVFIVVYFFNPAPVVIKDNCHEEQYLRGKVLYADQSLKAAEISIALLNKTDYTDGNGCFNIPYKGELELPLNIHLRYKTIDTIILLKKYDGKVIPINIKDTIPPLSIPLASKLIEGYLQEKQGKLEARHRGLLVQHGGKKAFFEDICRIYKYHEGFCSSHRNAVFFENSFEQLSTQKAMVQAGIPIKPLNPYGAYYLNNFEAYLYEIDTVKEGVKRSCRIHFALINLNRAKFKIDELSSFTDSKCLMKVSFQDNIRFVRTNASFSNEQAKKVMSEYANRSEELKTIQSGAKYKKVSGGRKEQTTYYIGVRPSEEFIVTYTEGRWQITGTR